MIGEGKIAVFFEASGIVRDALISLGFPAVSVDLRPTERPGPHIVGNVFDYLDAGWRGAIMHPTCTYLCSSGLHRNKGNPIRAAKTEAALEDVRRLMAAPIERWAIENPIGRIGTAIRAADQIIQPYQFGEDASKATGLWLKGLPYLMPTGRLPGRWVLDPKTGKPVERWSNQTDSGQNRLSPSADRWAERSQTYPRIAAAIAQQWGPVFFGDRRAAANDSAPFEEAAA